MIEDFKTFSQGYDGGYHDGYLACGEKCLSKIEEIKTYVHNYIIIAEDEEKKLFGIIDGMVNEVTNEQQM